MAADFVRDKASADICDELRRLNYLTIVSSSRVSLERKKLGVIDTELVQAFNDLY